MADVLRVRPLARLKLSRNEATLYDQNYAPNERAFVESSADRFVLAANTTVQEVNLGGVATGDMLLLITNRAINVGVDSQTNLWSVGKAVMLDGGSFTHLYVQNQSTTVEATVDVLVTD